MAKMIIRASRDGGLFQALAIGLGMEILSGTLDEQKNTPGYIRLLDIFARHHPNFTPKTWDNLKRWLAFYNASQDMELVFAPVLLQLNHYYPVSPAEHVSPRAQILTAKKAHQKVYCFDDVTRMAKALHFNLAKTEYGFGGELEANQEKVTINLHYANRGWHVSTDEDNCYLINRTHRRLKMSVNQAFQGKISIAAPNEEDLKELEAPKIQIHQKIIDNPGGGDCAFYAFVIALINIIKEEHVYKNRLMFNRWIELDPSIAEHFTAICSFDFDRPDNELLYQLQRSLRTITHFSQLDELKRACSDRENYTDPKNMYKVIVGNSIYVKFVEFYYDPYTDARFNEFADSDKMFNEILTIDRNQVKENFEHLVLVPKFVSLIYGEGIRPQSVTLDRNPMDGSPVVEAMGAITEDAFWGTHLNLDYLAKAFGVNFHPLKNLQPLQEFNDIPGLHTVTINNVDNVHWTTKVEYGSELKSLIVNTFDTKTAGVSGNEVNGEELAKRSELLSSANGNNKPIESRTIKKVRFSLTPEQLEAERLAEEKDKEKLEQTTKLLELEASKIAENAATISEHEKRQLEFLRGVATIATIAYVDYSNNIWFSLFHRHGQSGRVRAQEFLAQFLIIDDLDEAKVFLITYLSNNNNNGNTYPHSFRTMLLNELLKDPKPTLQYTSEHFDELLDELSNVLGVNLRLLECSM